MWIDTNSCDRRFHQIRKDAEGNWQVIHSDDSPCEGAEFDISDIVED